MVEHYDLGAFVVTLRATHRLTIRQHMGRAAQQMGLALIQAVDAALSEELHAPNQTQAYAVSGLLRPDNDQPAWGEITPPH